MCLVPGPDILYCTVCTVYKQKPIICTSMYTIHTVAPDPDVTGTDVTGTDLCGDSDSFAHNTMHIC